MNRKILINKLSIGHNGNPDSKATLPRPVKNYT